MNKTLKEFMREYHVGDSKYSNIYYECDVKRAVKEFEQYIKDNEVMATMLLDKYKEIFGEFD